MATIKTKKSNEAIDIEVKRFYLPGTVIHDGCPKCGKPAKLDLSQDYLSFPVANVVEETSMYCLHCDENWTVKTKLTIKLELA